MKQYSVSGMSCAACSARVEKAVSKVPGVTSCSVSLLTNSMGVEGSASEQEIVEAVVEAGYGAALQKKAKEDGENLTAESENEQLEASLKDTETPKMKRRLIASLVFLLPLMYVSMGHMMWNWPLPAVLADNHIAMGLLELLLTAIVMVINQKFFINGFKGLIKGAPNMDTLVALGSFASFAYSVYALFAMTGAQLAGDGAAVMAYMHEFYFESAAMILTLITVGKMLEARSKGKTTDALKGLMKLAPKKAVILIDGVETEVPIARVKQGDTFVVRPGESIPVDGVILEGSSALNEAALTGESIPVDKNPGDSVFSATLNQTGFLTCTATRVGEDTTLSQIIQMVSDAAATKAPIAKIADKVSGVFVPVVIGIAVLAFLVWMLTGESFGFALSRAIAVLVISCPCALGLATPVAIMVGNGVGAKHGIMFKTAVSLEETGKTKLVALDKTGTITKGEPKVTDIFTIEQIENDMLAQPEAQQVSRFLQIAFALEKRSEHPLAKAVVEEVNKRDSESNRVGNSGAESTDKLTQAEITDFQVVPGNGLTAMENGKPIAGGNLSFIEQYVQVDGKVKEKAAKLAEEGKTPLFFAEGDKLLGIIAVADVIKEDSQQAIKELQDMGIRVVMLTGDNERTAHAIAKEAGVDEVIAGVLPDGKEAVISELKRQGKVAMVGDGINDAPALTSADIGIAIGAGADIAIDAADVVLMKSSLLDVPAAIRLSRAALRNIHENLFWAFFYNVIGIPLAAGLWIPITGWTLNPMFGAAAMSLSSFCVVMNALRLNLVKIYAGNKTNKEEKMEEIKMKETVVKVEGMMCAHCEAHVNESIKQNFDVKDVQSSHEKGETVILSENELDGEKVKEAIEKAGYKVLKINSK